MTQAEHYARAEYLLGTATRPGDMRSDRKMLVLAQAQVHATLATVDPATLDQPGDSE